MSDSYLKDVAVSSYFLSPRFSFVYIDFFFPFLILQWGFILYFIPYCMHMYTGNVFLAVTKLENLMQWVEQIFLITSPHILSILVLQRGLKK